jgi:hypothetical protein
MEVDDDVDFLGCGGCGGCEVEVCRKRGEVWEVGGTSYMGAGQPAKLSMPQTRLVTPLPTLPFHGHISLQMPPEEPYNLPENRKSRAGTIYARFVYFA